MQVPSVTPQITAVPPTGGTVQARRASGASEGGFGEMVGNLLKEVNETQAAADGTVRDLMAGNVDNIHDVVLKVAKADLSFRFLLEIRNKLTEAYQDIARMPL